MTAPKQIKKCSCCKEQKDRSEFPFPRSTVCSACKVSRVCMTCGERKPIEEFPLATGERSRAEGRRIRKCHPCKLADRRSAYQQTKLYRMKWQYGITPEQWEAMFEAQGRRCANPGCRAEEPGGQGWCTDHDHACCPEKSRSCGRCIRGILCFKCNVMLGCAKDSPDILRGAITYLAAPAAMYS